MPFDAGQGLIFRGALEKAVMPRISKRREINALKLEVEELGIQKVIGLKNLHPISAESKVKVYVL